MDVLGDAEARTRHIQRDIEQTRDQMDHTLTTLERRLAPEEIWQRSTRAVRDRLRSAAESTVQAVKRHPAPLILGGLVIGTSYALRPSARQHRQRQAQEDFERAWSVLSVGLTRAKEQSQLGRGKVGAWVRDAALEAGRQAQPVGRWLQRARQEWRSDKPAPALGALAILGLTLGAIALGARRLRS